MVGDRAFLAARRGHLVALAGVPLAATALVLRGAVEGEPYALTSALALAGCTAVLGGAAVAALGIRSSRLQWFRILLGAAAIVFGTGQLLVAWQVQGGYPGYPTPGDLVSGCAVVPAVLGIALVPRRTREAGRALRLVLEGLMMGSAAGLLLWRTVLMDVVDTPGVELSSLAMLVLEIVVASIAVIAAVRELDRGLVLLAGGFSLYTVFDVVAIHAVLQGRAVAVRERPGRVRGLALHHRGPEHDQRQPERDARAAAPRCGDPAPGRRGRRVHADAPGGAGLVRRLPGAGHHRPGALDRLRRRVRRAASSCGRSRTGACSSGSRASPVATRSPACATGVRCPSGWTSSPAGARPRGRATAAGGSSPSTWTASRTSTTCSATRPATWCSSWSPRRSRTTWATTAPTSSASAATSSASWPPAPRPRCGSWPSRCSWRSRAACAAPPASPASTSRSASAPTGSGSAPAPAATQVGIAASGQAMRQAKRDGRGRVVVFSEPLAARSRRRQLMERQLRDTVAAGGVDVHFQPVYDVWTGYLTGVEALARWNDPVLGEVSPGEFIEVAEEAGPHRRDGPADHAQGAAADGRLRRRGPRRPGRGQRLDDPAARPVLRRRSSRRRSWRSASSRPRSCSR